MRSVRRQHVLVRLAVAGCTGTLIAAGASGCQTTQEKAAQHQAEAQRILDAREQRQKEKKEKKKDKGGKDQAPRQNGGKKQ